MSPVADPELLRRLAARSVELAPLFDVAPEVARHWHFLDLSWLCRQWDLANWWARTELAMLDLAGPDVPAQVGATFEPLALVIARRVLDALSRLCSDLAWWYLGRHPVLRVLPALPVLFVLAYGLGYL